MTADCVLWGEWSNCYSNEHCGIGWKNRTRKASQSSFCESDAPLVEYEKCFNPCSSFHLQGIISYTYIIIIILLYHWSRCTNPCYNCCFADSHNLTAMSIYLDWTKMLYVKVSHHTCILELARAHTPCALQHYNNVKPLDPVYNLMILTVA